MMRALVSVRDLDEARCVAAAGVPLIDLKEPARGALGAVPLARLQAVVAELRRCAPAARLSATVGDWPADAAEAIWRETVTRVAEAGVDDVKVGVPRGPMARSWLVALGRLRRSGLSVVPVLLVDEGPGPAGVAADSLACALDQGFAAVMLDTQDKRAGSLLERMPVAALSVFVQRVQAHGAWAGLAGSLPLSAVPALAGLAPDFVGFRSAVCEGDRAGQLSPARLAALCEALAEPQSGIRAEGAKST